MLPIIALAVRALVQAAVTLGVLSFIESTILPLINKGIQELMKVFGVSEEEAKDIMANEVIQFAESVGVLAVTLRTKIPTKIAERLGFTSKGYGRRALSPKAQSAVAGELPVARSVPPTKALQVQELAESIAKTTSGQGVAGFAKAQFIINVLSVPFLAGILLVNLGDWAAWPTSAYAKTFRKLFALVGLQPDEVLPQSKLLSQDTFNKVFTSLQNSGVVGINDPYKMQTVIFSRQALIDLIDKIYAVHFVQTGSAKAKEVLGTITAFMVFSPEVKAEQPEIAAPAAAPKQPSLPSVIKIEGLPFGQIIVPAKTIERITSAQELQFAVRDTVARFINQIPNRLSFVIKQVKFWIDQNGQLIKPSPVTYVEYKDTPDGKKPVIKQNKIVLLEVSFVTHENRQVKIFAVPLDYSIADNVITPLPGQAMELIPVQLGVLNQELAVGQEALVPPSGALAVPGGTAGAFQGVGAMSPSVELVPPAPPAAEEVGPREFKVGDKYDLLGGGGNVLGYKAITRIDDREQGLKIVTLGPDVDTAGTGLVQGGEQYLILAPAGFVDFSGRPVSWDLRKAPRWNSPGSGIQTAIDYMKSR